MKTKSEFKAKAAEAVALAESLAKQFEAARAAWRRSGYNDDNAYKEFCRIDYEWNAAKRDVDRYTLLASDGPIYANQAFYTDWEPWEVIEIKTDRKLVVRKMIAEPEPEAKKKLHDSFVPGGFCGHFDNDLQEWVYKSDENGEIAEVRLHKDGAYHLAGSEGTRFYLDTEPYKFFDYNF